MKKILSLVVLSAMVLMGASCEKQDDRKPILPPAPVVNSPTPTDDSKDVLEEDSKDISDNESDDDAKDISEVKTPTPLPPVTPSTPSTSDSTYVPKTVTFDVVADNFSFSPSELKVHKGDTVKINFLSKDVTHGLNITEYKVNVISPVGESVTTSFVADKVGTFSFRCSVYCGSGHKAMIGSLVVEE